MYKIGFRANQAGPTDYQICWLGLISLVQSASPTSTCIIHREKLKVLCPLPSANWTRFSINNLLDIIFMKKEKINTSTLFIYLHLFYWKESDSARKIQRGQILKEWLWKKNTSEKENKENKLGGWTKRALSCFPNT